MKKINKTQLKHAAKLVLSATAKIAKIGKYWEVTLAWSDGHELVLKGTSLLNAANRNSALKTYFQ